MFLKDYNHIIFLVGVVTAGLIGLALAINCVKWLLRLRQKKTKRLLMLELLQSARTEGSSFYIQMSDQDEIMGDMQWHCDEITSHGVLLTLPGQNFKDNNLFEAQHSIVVFFKVFYKGQDRYYSFNARVQALSDSQSGTTILVSLPEELGTSQKRKFLRIKPVQGSVEAFTVWRFAYALTQESLDEANNGQRRRSQDVMLNEANWPNSDPDWVIMPAAKVSVHDISEGGLCLRVQGRRNALVNKERVVIHIQLGGPFASGISDLYFFGEVMRYSMVTPRAMETGPVFKLGIKFLRWAQRRGDDYQWRAVSERANIAPLVGWIRRQHQFQHRLVD